ncbi:uncharacterized protein BDV14DRAFT_199115 [Aspergillus stella-maris]|uniref:uncharacterized protein n=1 Tax=Aspergillus stella-maris TaxID=1810926 RepID=UPI003CCD4430
MGHSQELDGWYIYLEQSPGDHIVGHWAWNDLKDNERWYEEIVLPAFQEHDKKFWAEQDMLEKDKVENQKVEKEKAKSGLTIIKLDPPVLEKESIKGKESDSDEDSIALAKKGLQKEERKRKIICGMTARVMRGIASTRLFTRKTKESKGKKRANEKTAMSEKKGL